jgi:hypothetical protein
MTSLQFLNLEQKYITSSWVLHFKFFLTSFDIISDYTPTYVEITKQTNKQRTSLQLQVEKWIKNLNYPQNMICYNI